MITVIKDNFKSIVEVVSLDIIGITTVVWLNDSMTIFKSIVAICVGLATLYLTYRKITNLSMDGELQRLEIEKVRLEVARLKEENEQKLKDNEKAR